LPDICLAAQITGNQRFDVDLSPYPTIRRISLALKEVEAFLHQLISLDCGRGDLLWRSMKPQRLGSPIASRPGVDRL